MIRKKPWVLVFVLFFVIASSSGCAQIGLSPEGSSSTELKTTTSNTETQAEVTMFDNTDGHPNISMKTDKSTYSTTEKIQVSITDNANVGFSFTDDFELWELDGENWVLKSKSENAQPPILYQVKPHPTKDSVTTMRYVPLSNYKEVKPQKQYKLAITIDGQSVTAEFATSSN